MKRWVRHAGQIIGFASIVLLFLMGLLYFCGGRINTSSSIAQGLYWVTKNPIKKGEYVLFCPPQKPIFQEALTRRYIHSGFCSGGFGYLMKQVAATWGDNVSINHHGVWVNHQYLAHSTPYVVDDQGRSLPQINVHHYPLKHNEILLMSDQSELSFDARYFGVVNTTEIKAVIKPVLTWSSIT